MNYYPVLNLSTLLIGIFPLKPHNYLYTAGSAQPVYTPSKAPIDCPSIKLQLEVNILHLCVVFTVIRNNYFAILYIDY